MAAFRLIGVHLLVVVLVACPLVCLPGTMTGHSNRAADHALRLQTCACCSHSEPVPQHRGDPVRPATSGTCLCHGAVMQAAAKPPVPTAGLVAALPPAEVAIRGQSCDPDSLVSYPATIFHAAAANLGRCLRARIESFLL